jgi:hypothetical protein
VTAFNGLRDIDIDRAIPGWQHRRQKYEKQEDGLLKSPSRTAACRKAFFYIQKKLVDGKPKESMDSRCKSMLSAFGRQP